MLSDVSVVELENVEDVWENADGSLGILFSTLIFKTRNGLHRSYKKLFEARSGEMEKDGTIYSLVGVLQLWEGEAYCYASNPWEVSSAERNHEVQERVNAYLRGKEEINELMFGDDLDDVFLSLKDDIEHYMKRQAEKIKIEIFVDVSLNEELDAHASKVTS